MTTMGDKSESESRISLERLKVAMFWQLFGVLGMTKNNKRSIKRRGGKI